MKENTITRLQGSKRQIRRQAAKQRLTVGIDLGDRSSRYCILDEAGEKVSEDKLPTTRTGLSSVLGKMAPCRIALEVGSHSPWVSRHLERMGHEVIVANPRRVKLISESLQKNDRMDARTLAELAHANPKLLSPIRHRGEQAQQHLAVVRGRAGLVEARTKLINSARGLLKPLGERLKECDAEQVGEEMLEGISESARLVLEPLMRSIEKISEEVQVYDQQIEEIAKEYGELYLLKQVYGIGTLTALTYLLVIEDANRFPHSRDVGSYLGLVPKQRESGESRPELGISKAGDRLLRSYLVQAAHCQLRKNAPESDLRTWGMKKAGTGKGSKRRVIVAMARKLAVLLHRLWVTGEVYDPLYNRKMEEQRAAKRAKAAA